MKHNLKKTEKIKHSIITIIFILASAITVLATTAATYFTTPSLLENLSQIFPAVESVLYATDNVSSQDLTGNSTRLANTDSITYIYDAQDLVDFRNAVNAGNNYAGKTVKLMNDLDLSSVCSESLGSWTSIGEATPFSGTLDGNNHTIKNLYHEGKKTFNGFIAYNKGKICNLTLANSIIKTENVMGYTAALVSYNQIGGIIQNCKIEDTVTVTGIADGTYLCVGGIAGANDGVITRCINAGKIYAKQNGQNYTMAGGIAAINQVKNDSKAIIEESYNIGFVSGDSLSTTQNMAPHIGGVLGQNYTNATLRKCYNAGTVQSTGNSSFPSTAGVVGIVQKNSLVENCYNTGKVTYTTQGNVYSRTGGVVGSADEGVRVRNCYNIGSVSATTNGTNAIGGVAGAIQISGNVDNSYALSGIGVSSVYGRIEQQGTITNSSMKTSTELKALAPTLGDAFMPDTYNMNQGYPILKWEIPYLQITPKYLTVGATLQARFVDGTQKLTNKSLTWTSSNEAVATIDQNGIITGKSLGTTTITVKENNTGITLAEEIDVVEILENTQDITYIYDAQDLVDFRNTVNGGNNYAGKTVKLMANIDLEEVCSEVLGSWTPIGDNGADSSLCFSGTFNGNGHTIQNIYLNNTSTGRNGLFGQVARGKIENLTITGNITSNKTLVGGIAGQIAHNAVIENCKNYANVTCSHTDTTYTVAGGITGQSYNSNIIKCENYGTIIAPNCAGGIAGQINIKGTIQDCYNEGTVKSTVAAASGGILGYCVANTKVTIYNCKNVGYIEVATTGVGGIVGGSGGKIDIYNCINEGRCYAKGTGAAGILGYNDTNSTMTKIKYCFNKGTIHADKWGAGGIVGNIQRNTEITHCNNTGEVIATNGNSGGIVGGGGADDTVITYVKIDNCFNQGYIHSPGSIEGHPVAGGIMGCIQLGDYAVITNCYNVGKIASTSYTSGYVAHGVGGILGTIWSNQKVTSINSKATIQNCYNIGNITNSYSSSNTGQVIGKSHTGEHTITNCHYLSTAAGSNSLGGTSQTANNLKVLAPTLGDEFATDSYNINQGYPILEWQIQPVLNIRQEYIKVDQVFDINILQTEMLQKVLGNYDDTHFTWTSSNEEIASIDEQGRVTGKQLGSTTITVTHTNGMKARAIVYVMNAGENVVTMPSVQVAEFYDDARSTFTAFLKEDGTVWTTGNNTYGQCRQWNYYF